MSPGHSTLIGSKRIPLLRIFSLAEPQTCIFGSSSFSFPFCLPDRLLPVNKIIGIKSQEVICATPCFEPMQQIAAKGSVALFEQLMKQTRPDQRTGLGLPEHHRTFRHPSQALSTLSAKPCVCQSPSLIAALMPYPHQLATDLRAGAATCKLYSAQLTIIWHIWLDLEYITRPLRPRHKHRRLLPRIENKNNWGFIAEIIGKSRPRDGHGDRCMTTHQPHRVTLVIGVPQPLDTTPERAQPGNARCGECSA
jgi:hypothetical protein